MKSLILALLTLTLLLSISSCNIDQAPPPTSSSGVAKATVKVKTDLDGYTTEQKNVMQRLEEDNRPGAIKYLYLISTYTGDVLLSSVVRGKVTSSGKRLTPVTVAAFGGEYNYSEGAIVNISGRQYQTNEVLQDDGTYGSSVEYIYWFDSKGVYNTLYPQSGATIVISSQPLTIRKAIINVDESHSK